MRQCRSPFPYSGRTWPAPERRWDMWMTWHDLLFAHWTVPVKQLRALIPSPLQIDTYQGEAWLGVVPFGMRNIRHRLLPCIPGTSRFPELNVRTYVTVDGKPGVWFFSLDAANRLAVFTARRWFHLPYLRARMSLRSGADNSIVFQSVRTHRNATRAEFSARYRPVGKSYQTRPGELDHWLTARYCLYAADRRGQVWRGDIDHEPWTLQRATAEIDEQRLVEPLGLHRANTPPLLHFVQQLDVVAWTLEAVG